MSLTALLRCHHKATIAWPPQDMPYGTRESGLIDCNGYHLARVQRRAA